MLLLVLPGGCGGDTVDVEQARLCRALIAAVEPPGAAPAGLSEEPGATPGRSVVVRYAVAGESRWIACRFAGAGLETDRLDLVAVETSREGVLSPARFFMLERFWLGSPERQALIAGQRQDAEAAARAASIDPGRALAYLAQQLVNGLTVSCLYGLLAIGYTLVYALLERINLAFGELATVGAYAGLSAIVAGTAAGATAGAGLAAAIALVFAAAIGVGAVYGSTTWRILFRPLAEASSQAPLIATIGLVIVIQETLHLTRGAREHWTQPVLTDPHVVIDAGGFTTVVTDSRLLVLGVTIVLYLALWRIMTRTAFGRRFRAAADDPLAARLLGIDTDRLARQAFALGGVAAGAAGAIFALVYSGVGFTMGLAVGLKALTAAIVGGIGSFGGAMLGGLVIGMFETLWSAYLDGDWRDVGVFSLLVAVLVLRPHGLLGVPRGRGD